MKTVAFSVKMGMQLSHVDSTSLRTAYDASNEVRCKSPSCTSPLVV